MKIATVHDVKPGMDIAIRAIDCEDKYVKNMRHVHVFRVTDVKLEPMGKKLFVNLKGNYLDEDYNFESDKQDINAVLSTDPVIIFDKVVELYCELNDVPEFTAALVIQFDDDAGELLHETLNSENPIFHVVTVRRQDPDQGIAFVQTMAVDGEEDADDAMTYFTDEDGECPQEVIRVE